MRLFVAATLDEEVRASLARVGGSLGPVGSVVRWVRADRLHLTLKFLGEVADAQVEAVARCAAEAVVSIPAFAFRVAGCGCFPDRGPVRVVWAGVIGDTSPLVRCAEAVDKALSDIGFPKERRGFSPHITLGRVRTDETGIELRKKVGSVRLAERRQTVSSLSLMSSVLSSDGPYYAPVATLPLAGSR